MIKLVKGHWYMIRNEWIATIGQYMGTSQGFECCVCGKGHKAHEFNSWYETKRHDGTIHQDYETLAFGREHMPIIMEDLGVSDKPFIMIDPTDPRERVLQ